MWVPYPYKGCRVLLQFEQAAADVLRAHYASPDGGVAASEVKDVQVCLFSTTPLKRSKTRSIRDLEVCESRLWQGGMHSRAACKACYINRDPLLTPQPLKP